MLYTRSKEFIAPLFLIWLVKKRKKESLLLCMHTITLSYPICVKQASPMPPHNRFIEAIAFIQSF